MEEFKNKALQVLKAQRFGPLPLFEFDDLDDYEVTDDNGSMNFEEFLELFYESLHNGG